MVVKENSTGRKMSGYAPSGKGKVVEGRSRRNTGDGKALEEDSRRRRKSSGSSKPEGNKTYTSITILEVRDNEEEEED